MTLLQVPGGPELLVIALIFLILSGLAFGLLVGMIAIRRQPTGDADETERIEELERRVETLEAELRGEADSDASEGSKRTERHDEP